MRARPGRAHRAGRWCCLKLLLRASFYVHTSLGRLAEHAAARVMRSAHEAGAVGACACCACMGAA
jgi:hypothetical protein